MTTERTSGFVALKVGPNKRIILRIDSDGHVERMETAHAGDAATKGDAEMKGDAQC